METIDGFVKSAKSAKEQKKGGMKEAADAAENIRKWVSDFFDLLSKNKPSSVDLCASLSGSVVHLAVFLKEKVAFLAILFGMLLTRLNLKFHIKYVRN